MSFVNDFTLSSIQYVAVKNFREWRSITVNSDVFLGYFCQEHIVIIHLLIVKQG